jgi:hypothetical protein
VRERDERHHAPVVDELERDLPLVLQPVGEPAARVVGAVDPRLRRSTATSDVPRLLERA